MTFGEIGEIAKQEKLKEFLMTHIDMMTIDEIAELEQTCRFVFGTDLNLQVYFEQMKINIEGTFVVLYINLKHMVEYELKMQNIIDQEFVPFVPFSDAITTHSELHNKLLTHYY